MKIETHLLQLGRKRITVRVEDRRPDDLPTVQIMADPDLDYNDARLVPWMRNVLLRYGPHTIAAIRTAT